MQAVVLASLISLVAATQPSETTDHPKVVETGFDKIVVRFQPPPPPYPSEAKKAKAEGNVIVELTINTEGVPTKAVAVSGPEELRPHSEAYAMKWLFAPVVLDGVPQYARFKLVFPFRLRK